MDGDEDKRLKRHWIGKDKEGLRFDVNVKDGSTCQLAVFLSGAPDKKPTERRVRILDATDGEVLSETTYVADNKRPHTYLRWQVSGYVVVHVDAGRGWTTVQGLFLDPAGGAAAR